MSDRFKASQARTRESDRAPLSLHSPRLLRISDHPAPGAREEGSEIEETAGLVVVVEAER